MTGVSIGNGLAAACDTLISQVKSRHGLFFSHKSHTILDLVVFMWMTSVCQTYGSGNLKLVGIILQRGVLIVLLACFPCWAVLLNTEPILLAVKQNPEVAQ